MRSGIGTMSFELFSSPRTSSFRMGWFLCTDAILCKHSWWGAMEIFFLASVLFPLSVVAVMVGAAKFPLFTWLVAAGKIPVSFCLAFFLWVNWVYAYVGRRDLREAYIRDKKGGRFCSSPFTSGCRWWNNISRDMYIFLLLQISLLSFYFIHSPRGV